MKMQGREVDKKTNDFYNKELKSEQLQLKFKDAAHPKKERSDLIKQIGKSIAERRKTKNWTVQKLADETGIERTHLTKMEGGGTNATIESLSKIAKALNCKLVVEFVRNKKSGEECEE